MAEESREEVAFAEVLALGSGTRVLRAIATPTSVLFALLAFYLVVRAREHLPPTTPPPPPQLMTVTLETLPPPPPPPPEPAKPEPKAPVMHAPRAPAAQPVADDLDLSEVPQDDEPVPDVGPVMTAIPGPSGGSFAAPGEAYGTATHGVPGGHGKTRTKARSARATSYGWKCEWPAHAKEDSAWVSLRVLVSHDGRPLAVETFDATAPVYAQVAKTCAQEQEWLPALDENGNPVQAYTHVIKVFFTH